MEEDILSPEILAGIEPCHEFEHLTRVAEVQVIYRPNIPPGDRPTAKDMKEATRLMRPFFEPFIYHHEETWVMLLDNALHVLGVSRVAAGGLTSTMVDVRVLFQHVLKSNATGIILFHNHPSGNLRPSEADRRLSKRVQEICNLLDVSFLDHLILSGEESVSATG